MTNEYSDNLIKTSRAEWSFDGIEDNFDNHVTKSVPLYDDNHWLAVKLCDFFLTQNSSYLDIGCSTGSLVSKILDYLPESRNNIKIDLIEPVEGMLNKAKFRLRNYSSKNINYILDDAINHDWNSTKYDYITCMYTLQFIHPRVRQEILSSIYNSLNWGGAFLLAEKVRAPDARFQDIMIQTYHDFKQDNGFTDDQILAKQRSLRGVLEPFSTNGNLDLLKRAGFKDVMTISKMISFEMFLAIK